MAARRPILRWVDQATINSASVAQYAALVDVTSDDTQKVQLPAGARALRYHGIHLKGQMPNVFPAVGDKVELQKTGRAYVLLAGKNGGSAKTCLPGDWAVIHNALGQVSPYVLGSGTAHLLGTFKTKYTNGETTGAVPVEMDQFPCLVLQCERIDGFNRAIANNNTKYLTRDGSEAAADEVLFEAPWDGTLRGFRLSVETSGAPAGLITGTVRIKTLGGAWANAQIDAVDWTLALDAAVALYAEDTIGTDALASTKSLAILKGTKVAIKVLKDANIANITQLAGRLIFY